MHKYSNTNTLIQHMIIGSINRIQIFVSGIYILVLDIGDRSCALKKTLLLAQFAWKLTRQSVTSRSWEFFIFVDVIGTDIRQIC